MLLVFFKRLCFDDCYSAWISYISFLVWITVDADTDSIFIGDNKIPHSISSFFFAKKEKFHLLRAFLMLSCLPLRFFPLFLSSLSFRERTGTTGHQTSASSHLSFPLILLHQINCLFFFCCLRLLFSLFMQFWQQKKVAFCVLFLDSSNSSPGGGILFSFL